jgi:hypothetical protein
MAVAFQRNAFQDNAYQMRVLEVGSHIGSRIVAGTFSRGQWRDLKQDIAARRKWDEDEQAAAAALEAERKEAERQARIADIARQTAERRAKDDADLAAVLATLPPAAPTFDADQLQAAVSRVRQEVEGEQQRRAEALRRMALEEEEAAAAMLLM